MNLENVKIPIFLVLATAILTPLADQALHGTTTALTYVLEGLCTLAVLTLVIAGAINTLNDK